MCNSVLLCLTKINLTTNVYTILNKLKIFQVNIFQIFEIYVVYYFLFYELKKISFLINIYKQNKIIFCFLIKSTKLYYSRLILKYNL